MCKAASSSATPMSFVWRRDHDVLDLVNSKNHITTYAQTSNDTLVDNEYANLLHLVNVDDEDSGQYQCIASNNFGRVYAQKSQITVHVMPTFTKTPTNITNKVGSTARLECAAKGQPQPEISWQKDGGDTFPAARERRLHVMPADDVFFIVDVKVDDMGVYSCRAKNDAGEVVANATLTVLENPNFVKVMRSHFVA